MTIADRTGSPTGVIVNGADAVVEGTGVVEGVGGGGQVLVLWWDDVGQVVTRARILHTTAALAAMATYHRTKSLYQTMPYNNRKLVVVGLKYNMNNKKLNNVSFRRDNS
jgi:hypothetical protein